MKFRPVFSLFFAAAVLASAPAGATVVYGSSLQNALDARTFGSANQSIDADFYDVNDDQLGNDEVWNLSATAISASRLIFEFAGYANRNTFGIYDVNNPGNMLEIFSGADSAGDFEITVGAGNMFTTLVGGNMAVFSSRDFGFYLAGPGGTFYSQSALNAGQADQMVAYQGRDDIFVNASGYGAGRFTSGEYILAWEDLRLAHSDRDYNDFVVMVESVTPVPLPAPLALLGFGLLGLGLARRRA